MSGDSGKKINCFKCKFFKITWDPNFPYACRVYGFKGKNLPSVDVLDASGLACMQFTSKQEKTKQPEKNYPDYI